MVSKYFLKLNNQEKQGHQMLCFKSQEALSITLLKLVKQESPTATLYFMLSLMMSALKFLGPSGVQQVFYHGRYLKLHSNKSSA